MAEPTYATVEDLTAYLSSADELAEASRLIDSILVGAVYETDTAGVATDTTIKEAIKRATLIQVAFWQAGYGSRFGAPIYSNVSIGSITLSGGGSAGKDGKGGKTVIAPQARYELESAGLLPIFARTTG